MKTQINDGREEIYRALYRALKSKAKGLADSAWYVGVVGGTQTKSMPPGYPEPVEELRAAAKPGRFAEVMEACAQLGEWWLDQSQNSRHLMRADVEARIVECRTLTNG